MLAAGIPSLSCRKQASQTQCSHKCHAPLQDAPDAKPLAISQPPSVEFDAVTFAFVPGSLVLKHGEAQRHETAELLKIRILQKLI